MHLCKVFNAESLIREAFVSADFGVILASLGDLTRMDRRPLAALGGVGDVIRHVQEV
jgi:hypothetical protein